MASSVARKKLPTLYAIKFYHNIHHECLDFFFERCSPDAAIYSSTLIFSRDFFFPNSFAFFCKTTNVLKLHTIEFSSVFVYTNVTKFWGQDFIIVITFSDIAMAATSFLSSSDLPEFCFTGSCNSQTKTQKVYLGKRTKKKKEAKTVKHGTRIQDVSAK